jgi:hypothetical protein
MKIQVLRFNPFTGYLRTGFVSILYENMELICEVRIAKNKQHVWIKMPMAQTPIGLKEFKLLNCCTWPEKEHSDLFQKTVLEQLKQLHPEALRIPTNTERNKAKSERYKRKHPKNNPSSFKEPPKPNFIPGKARPVSKFAIKKI